KPVYLQLTLDQSYHPEGFYTFPSDAFMKDEIERSRKIGLNGIRPHIKVEIPRKLYWADKLGVLVMADLPNSWGDPDSKMQDEAERTLREMIKRDYNHPAIFSWILFNETWGLRTAMDEAGKKVSKYLPETQQWVASMYYLAKSLDATRLAEDNSICCGAGHTQTDINSFHDYLPGWEWEEHLKKLTENSFEGNTFQFEKGFKQGRQPKINSECGNVWGYEGSTGDVDWSWDYHRMMNTFRKYPEIAGWLYTEHHDVINEWNGYWRFDRSNKFTGVEEIFPGMKVNDFHSTVYISAGNEICKTVNGGEKIDLPLYLSSMTDSDFGKLKLSYKLMLTNAIGETSMISAGNKNVECKPYAQSELEPLSITMPDQAGLALLTLQLEDSKGSVVHRNFVHFEVLSENKLPKKEVLTVRPDAFTNASFTAKQWNVLDGLKVNGAGSGYFEYTFSLDNKTNINSIKEAYFLVEISAKELFVKDRADAKQTADLDFMLGAKASPSGNPNSYPMTDEKLYPSKITVTVNGETALSTTLPDNPADHRGVLSWHHQLKDKKLREAGSYGYLTRVPVTKSQLKRALENGKLVIQIKTNGNGGVAVYGKTFGRYPLDPSLVLTLK
ncbi:MAG: glycoside hydrolase family 2, partial [Marivirga sp.]|nr:glycoside hydrolase family 2 [Marivirga sp.]